MDAAGILRGRGRRPDRLPRAARRRPAVRLPRPRSRRARRWRARTVDRGRHVPDRVVPQAEIVLAAAGYAEKAGTATNLEGRVSTPQPEGHASPAPRRPTGSSPRISPFRLGVDLGLESVEEIRGEIAAGGAAASRRRSTRVGAAWAQPGTTASSTGRGRRGDRSDDDAGDPRELGATGRRRRSTALQLSRWLVGPQALRQRCGVHAVAVAGRLGCRHTSPSTPTTSTASACDARRPGAGHVAEDARSSTERCDPGVPRGVAAVRFNQPGVAVADLIDATAVVTDVGGDRPRKDLLLMFAVDPLLSRRRPRDRVDRHPQGRRRVRPAARRDHVDGLVRAQGDRRHAEPHRTRTRPGRGASCRRSPTASSCSSRKT